MNPKSPYDQFPDQKFWKRSVAAKAAPSLLDVFQPKFQITKESKIVTAGSCFAQHITQHLRANDFAIQDLEPAPKELSAEEAQRLAYNLYSARYGNIYTIRQLLQLYRESLGLFQPSDAIWERSGRYFDAIRPTVEPKGLKSSDLVSSNRKQHLTLVKDAFHLAEVFVFTFGLTECWEHIESGTVYPMAPGTIAGHFDEQIYRFKNLSFREVKDDFLDFYHLLKKHNKEVKFLLTVSPVHLVATASEQHVLSASIYSKSVLRAVAGELANQLEDIDYFPSYEIITNPAAKGQFYKDNSRGVSILGRDTVMKAFMRSYGFFKESASEPVREVKASQEAENGATNEVCDKELLNAFGSIQELNVERPEVQKHNEDAFSAFYPNQHKGLYHFKNVALRIGDIPRMIFFEEKGDILESFQADQATNSWIKSSAIPWDAKPEMTIFDSPEPVLLLLTDLNPAHTLVDSIFSTLVEIEANHKGGEALFKHHFIASARQVSSGDYQQNWSLFVHQQLSIIDSEGEVFRDRKKENSIFFFKHLVVTKYMRHRFAADWKKWERYINKDLFYIDTSAGMYPQGPLDFIHRHLLQNCFAYSPNERMEKKEKARILIYNRKDTQWRRWTNADEVCTYIKNHYKDQFSDLNFLSEDYAAYDPIQQADIFYQSDIIIMPHGSALANTIFSKPGTTVVEFNPSEKPYGWFHFCTRMKMDFYVVRPENFWYYNEKSFTVKPELLKPILDKAIQKYK